MPVADKVVQNLSQPLPIDADGSAPRETFQAHPRPVASRPFLQEGAELQGLRPPLPAFEEFPDAVHKPAEPRHLLIYDPKALFGSLPDRTQQQGVLNPYNPRGS